MDTDTAFQIEDLIIRKSTHPNEAQDRFAERWRIALLEEDRALRAVITRSLLRIGCVVTFKRCDAQVLEALREGTLHGVVVAREVDERQARSLHEANSKQVPIVVLTNTPPAPDQSQAHASLRFLQKPFDMRELFAHLNLPHSAKILRAG